MICIVTFGAKRLDFIFARTFGSPHEAYKHFVNKQREKRIICVHVMFEAPSTLPHIFKNHKIFAWIMGGTNVLQIVLPKRCSYTSVREMRGKFCYRLVPCISTSCVCHSYRFSALEILNQHDVFEGLTVPFCTWWCSCAESGFSLKPRHNDKQASDTKKEKLQAFAI